MSNNSRNLAIYEERKKGEKLTILANRYNLSRTRISQIYRKEERKAMLGDNQKKSSNPLDYISCRLANCLRNSFKFQELTLEKISKINPEELMKMRNFGKKSLLELKKLLNQYGYEYEIEPKRCPLCGTKIK